MDGKRGEDSVAPSLVTYTNPSGGPSDQYVHSGTDEDGTLVYRKK